MRTNELVEQLKALTAYVLPAPPGPQPWWPSMEPSNHMATALHVIALELDAIRGLLCLKAWPLVECKEDQLTRKEEKA